MPGALSDHPIAAHALSAAAATVVAASLTHPLDTLKSLLQVGAGPKPQLSLSQVVARVSWASGAAGLQSGLGWLTMARLSGLGARFGSYEIITAYVLDGRENRFVYYKEAWWAGIAAGAVESIVCTPFELFKLRNQVASTSPSKATTPTGMLTQSTPLMAKLLPGYAPDIKSLSNTCTHLSTLSPKHPELAGVLKGYPWMLTGSGRVPLASQVQGPYEVVSLEGWSALWRGLRPGIFRDAVFGGAFFSTWQFIRTAILTWQAVNMDPEPRYIEDAGPISPLASSLAAGVSGVVAAAASHVFDTAKTRSQCNVVPKYITMERKFLKFEMPGMWIQRVTGVLPGYRRFLFRGIWLRMARSGIMSFTTVGLYLFAVDRLL